jgi:hypothetical protein
VVEDISIAVNEKNEPAVIDCLYRDHNHQTTSTPSQIVEKRCHAQTANVQMKTEVKTTSNTTVKDSEVEKEGRHVERDSRTVDTEAAMGNR